MPAIVPISTFATVSPPWSLANLDANFSGIAGAFASANTFSSLGTDSGTANAYVVTLPASVVVTLAAGLPVQFAALNANTASSTLTVNGGATKALVNFNGTALTSGQIQANSIINAMYDGTSYRMLQFFTGSALSNSLSGNVSLNNTSNYFDGPTVAQGSVGIWLVTGGVCVLDSASSAQFAAKLWDGTNIIDSAEAQTSTSSGVSQLRISLSGVIISPSGNLKISVRDNTTTSGQILANGSSNGKDSTITAIRLA